MFFDSGTLFFDSGTLSLDTTFKFCFNLGRKSLSCFHLKKYHVFDMSLSKHIFFKKVTVQQLIDCQSKAVMFFPNSPLLYTDELIRNSRNSETLDSETQTLQLWKTQHCQRDPAARYAARLIHRKGQTPRRHENAKNQSFLSFNMASCQLQRESWTVSKVKT